jgi:preprotein translocase subunit YajC
MLPAPILLANGSDGFVSMLPMLLAFMAIFYFVLIRPQQREKRERARMMTELKKGDEVVLQSGILARIHRIESENPIAMVEVEGGVRMRILRDAILRRTAEAEPAVNGAKPAQAPKAKNAAG